MRSWSSGNNLKFDAMNIDRKAGCKLAGTCRSDYADDDELKGLHEEFMATAQQEFIDALESLKPSKLKRSGVFPQEEHIGVLRRVQHEDAVT